MCIRDSYYKDGPLTNCEDKRRAYTRLFSLYVPLFLRYVDTDHAKNFVAIRVVCLLSCSTLVSNNIQSEQCKIVLIERK